MFRTLFAAAGLSMLLGWSHPTQAVPLYDFSPVSAEMQLFVQTHSLPGASLWVGRAGNTLHRQAYGGYTLQTRVRIASASKWLSALAIARVVEKGQLRWSDTVGQYFPQAPQDKRAITLEQLFSHTSGMSPTEDNCLSNPFFSLGSCAERILQLPLIGTPGAVFAYGGNSMQVAGRMAELATGKSWDDLFLEEMVAPLGLVATDYATSSTAPGYVRNANPRIPGGVRSTLDDYGRVLTMVLARGCLDGGFPDNCPPERRFLSTATLDAMARDRRIGTTTYFSPPTTRDFGYGIGVWIENADGVNAQIPQPILSSPGAFGFTPWVNYVRGNAGALLVQGELSTLNADIVDIRAMVDVVTADNRSRRPRPPVSPSVRVSAAVKPTAALPASRSSSQAARAPVPQTASPSRRASVSGAPPAESNSRKQR